MNVKHTSIVTRSSGKRVGGKGTDGYRCRDSDVTMSKEAIENLISNSFGVANYECTLTDNELQPSKHSKTDDYNIGLKAANVINEPVSNSDDDNETGARELESIVKIEPSDIPTDGQIEQNVLDPESSTPTLRKRSKLGKARPFKCNECSYAAMTAYDLRKHSRYTHSKERPYLCSVCSHTAKTLNALQRHEIYKHSEERSFQCSDCNYTGKDLASLRSHRKYKHSDERAHKCSECSYSAKTRHGVKRHTQFIHRTDRPFKCSECSYEAMDKPRLFIHMQGKHNVEKPFKCTECSYAASLRYLLRRHMERHVATPQPKTNFKFDFLEDFDSEGESDIPNASSNYALQMDDDPLENSMEELSQENVLDVEPVIKIEPSDVLVDYQIKQMFSEPEVTKKKSTRNSRNSKKLIKCQECEQTFQYPSKLRHHMAYKHSKERPFSCSDCNFAAVDMTALRRHIETHKNATERHRKFKCPYCPHASFTKSHLQSHMTMHASKVPNQCKQYQCDHCNSAYNLKGHLNEHIKKKHLS